MAISRFLVVAYGDVTQLVKGAGCDPVNGGFDSRTSPQGRMLLWNPILLKRKPKFYSDSLSA